MRNVVGTLLAVALGAVVLVAPANAAPTSSAPAAAETRTFLTCSSMHRTYPNGIAVTTTAANRAFRNGYQRPAVRPVAYADSPRTLDRNRNGVMCAVKR